MASKSTREAEDTPSSLPTPPAGGGWVKLGFWLLLAPRLPFVWLLRGYRAVVSPLYGDVCKYYPSCSKYALDAFEVKGVLVGGVMTVWRILRCNPRSKGGVDYVAGSVLAQQSLELHAEE